MYCCYDTSCYLFFYFAIYFSCTYIITSKINGKPIKDIDLYIHEDDNTWVYKLHNDIPSRLSIQKQNDFSPLTQKMLIHFR